MATAATIAPSPVRPSLLPLAPIPSFSSRSEKSQPSPTSLNNFSVFQPRNEPAQGPCDGCRSRNSRCAMNAQSKKCYSCDFHRQECTFTPNTSRKRTHANSVSGMGWKEPSTPLIVTHFSDSALAATHGTTSHPVAPPNPLPQIRTYQHIGRTTDIEPLLLEYIPLDKSEEGWMANTKIRRISTSNHFVNVLTDSSYAHSASRRQLTEIEAVIGPYGADLLNVFFSKINPFFPIVDEDETWLMYKNRTIDPALLAMIFLLASKLLESSKISKVRIDVLQLETLAWSHVQSALHRSQLSTIQAGLLLQQHRRLAAPSTCAQLVTMAFELELHHDCSAWLISDSEKSLRRRIAWMLYAHDKWSSLANGRPAHIADTNWMVQTLTDQDFNCVRNAGSPRPTDFSQSSLLLRNMINLTCLLSVILETFYALKAANEIRSAGANGLRLILDKAKPIQIKLKDWFSRLPAELKMDAPFDEASLSNAMLHLAYFATEITLHRCIIRATAQEGTDPYLAYICRSAAKTRLISAMDFVNRLRSAHLQSFWPLSGFTNFALIGSFGVLLRATAPTSEEADFYRMRLEEYRWTLAVNNNEVDFLDYAVQSLDTNIDLLRYVPEKPDTAVLVESSSTQVISQPPILQPTVLRPEYQLESGSQDSSGLASPSLSTQSLTSSQEAYMEVHTLEEAS